MKKYIVTILTTILLVCNINTHAQQWQWAQKINPFQVIRSYLDDNGNVYMFGFFSPTSSIDGSEYFYPTTEGGWKSGIFVAKMNANREFVWKKVVRFKTLRAGIGGTFPQWIEFKEDAIYVFFSYECNTEGHDPNDRLHFFGEEKNKAEIEVTEQLPFKNGQWTAFVKFSYEGEVLEQHFIQLVDRRTIEMGYNTGTILIPYSLFHVDNRGNTYIFTTLSIVTGVSAETPFMLRLDNDSIYNFTIPKEGDHGYEPIIIKLNSDWQVQWVKSMYHNIVDIANSTIVNPYLHRFRGLSFDEDDNMYLTGHIRFLPNAINENQLPIDIYLDEEHKIVINAGGLNSVINSYIIKYDTLGNVQWCNQSYSKHITSTSTSDNTSRNFYGSTLSDNAVFILGNAGNTSSTKSYFYNGEENMELIGSCSTQNAMTFIAKFDKETGLYLAHDIIPNNILTTPRNSEMPFCEPAIINNHIIATSAFGIDQKNMLIASFNSDNCRLVEILDTIYLANQDLNSETGSIRINNEGNMLLDFRSGENTITLSNLPPTYTNQYPTQVFALKNDPRLLIPYDSIHVTGVTLNRNTTTLSVGSTERLIATVLPTNASNVNVTWSSSAPTVATVSNRGLINAVSPGTTTITVTTQNGNNTAQCAVTVNAAINVIGVDLNKDTVTLPVGNTELLIVTVLPTNASNQNVTWSSSVPSVATVSNGLVTALSIGTTTITVTTQDGNHTTQCVVTVTAAVSVTGVNLNQNAITLTFGNTEQLIATVLPTDASNKNVTWMLLGPNVASVNNDGLVTALFSEGTPV